ncbi:MAG: hypothetical protein II126_02160 [Erysipelotrichaceae bacterium]|nr:hypothetical protein [Erysipelotrichaceae bacterium]
MLKNRKTLVRGLILLMVSCLLLSVSGCKQKEPERGIFDFYTAAGSTYTSSWKLDSNVGKLNASVEKGVRAKYTTIKGDNKDTITIMVYMCGSDLESRSAMASYDIQEMAKATVGNNINLILYTGGTTKWNLNGISTQHNMILQVTGGKLKILVENAGNAAMVTPSTLTSFIEYCAKNFKANRNMLILWDHGAGSVAGYGRDEKYPNNGSMSLAGIDEALTEADVKFDFIGFDACLMANTETALMLTEHADYMIASEESEPGIGWYYTDWLTALSSNTSMPTIEIGKNIADSFVSECKTTTPRQPATLSVVDLAEVQDVIDEKLSAFSKSATNLIKNNEYRRIASARSGAREFAASSSVDLVDLVDMANSVGTEEAKDLVKSLLNCIKYNNVSSSMSNSYGLSIYFPYRSSKYLKTINSVYNQIDMNADYSECIRSFASYQTTGQVASGGSSNATQSFQSYNNSSYQTQGSGELLYQLINSFATGSQEVQQEPSYSSLIEYGLISLLGSLMSDRSLTDYVVANHFDADLTWKDGKINLTEAQWKMVEDLKVNMFVDDGTGYIDLGCDNIYDIDEKGNLLALTEKTWLAASADGSKWQVIPYYYMFCIKDGEKVVSSTGRIPVRINGERANLLIELDDEAIEVVGVNYQYDEADVVAKYTEGLKENDVIEFVCGYYDYDGNYQSSHIMGNPITYSGKLYFGDVSIADYKTVGTYQFRDIYQQNYWTTPME